MTGKQKHTIAKAKSHIEAFFKAEFDPVDFPYHDIEHTKSVVRSASFICEYEQVDDQTCTEIILAAWFHDVGYAEDPQNHEALGCQFLENFLIENGVTDLNNERLSKLIQATNLVTQPTSLAEQIIKDADLHYLGTHAYLDIAEDLRTEWKRLKGVEYTDLEWSGVNLDFFKYHQFYTATALLHYQPIKDENFRILQDQIDQ